MQNLPAPSKEVVVARPPESLIASAAQFGDSNFKDFGLISSTQDSAWQEEAWRFYRIIGEFRYSCDWVGGQLSKALIHATVYRDGRVQQVESGHAAAGIIDEIFDDPDGRAEMFRLLGGGIFGDTPAGLPNSQLAILPGTSHVSVVDRTELLIPILNSFLDAPMPQDKNEG